MKDKNIKKVLYSLGIIAVVASGAFMIHKQYESNKKGKTKSKERANSAYYDTLTPTDIAWG